MSTQSLSPHRPHARAAGARPPAARAARPRPGRTARAPLPVVLTPAGRAELAERARRLREETLPRLRPLLVEWQRDERMVAEFARAEAELDRLEGLLAEAGVLAPDPLSFDGRAELGCEAVLELPGGEREVVRLVHPVEVPFGDDRISVEGPLARALLGARAGHTVWVEAPAGPWPCRVAEVRVPLDGAGVAAVA